MINDITLYPSLRTIEYNIIPFLLSIFLIFPVLLGSKVNASWNVSWKLFHKWDPGGYEAWWEQFFFFFYKMQVENIHVSILQLLEFSSRDSAIAVL